MPSSPQRRHASRRRSVRRAMSRSVEASPEVVHPGQRMPVGQLEHDPAPCVRIQRRDERRERPARCRACGRRSRRRPSATSPPTSGQRAAHGRAGATPASRRRRSRNASSMSACRSTPMIEPARPASGSDVAPPPTPTSRTVPLVGERLQRATRSWAVATGRPRRRPWRAARNSSAGKPQGDSGAASRIAWGIAQARERACASRSSGGHRSEHLVRRARPSVGGGSRVGRRSPVEPHRVGAPGGGRRPRAGSATVSISAAPSGEANTSSIVRIGAHGTAAASSALEPCRPAVRVGERLAEHRRPARRDAPPAPRS